MERQQLRQKLSALFALRKGVTKLFRILGDFLSDLIDEVAEVLCIIVDKFIEFMLSPRGRMFYCLVLEAEGGGAVQVRPVITIGGA